MPKVYVTLFLGINLFKFPMFIHLALQNESILDGVETWWNVTWVNCLSNVNTCNIHLKLLRKAGSDSQPLSSIWHCHLSPNPSSKNLSYAGGRSYYHLDGTPREIYNIHLEKSPKLLFYHFLSRDPTSSWTKDKVAHAVHMLSSKHKIYLRCAPKMYTYTCLRATKCVSRDMSYTILPCKQTNNKQTTIQKDG